MPAINRRPRASPTNQQAVQQCVSLLSIDTHKLAKVRSIGLPSSAGDSQVQVVLASGDSLQCIVPQNLQGQLLFRGSGFFIVAPPKAADHTQDTHSYPSTNGKSGVPQLAPDNSNQLALSDHDARNSVFVDSQSDVEPCWHVVYVLADADLPELARQGLWPEQFEAEGIDGITNGQSVDLRTVSRADPPSHAVASAVTKSAVLNKTFYNSDDDDEEDEEHLLGCACCPGGRNVVFRVY